MCVFVICGSITGTVTKANTDNVIIKNNLDLPRKCRIRSLE